MKLNRSPAMVVLRVLSALELISLAVILTNRFTVHLPVVTSTGGPLHGLFYVSTILLALFLPLPRASKWLAAVPGVGGVLALWRARRHTPAPADEPPSALDLTDEQRRQAIVIADRVTATLSSDTRIGPLSFAVPRGTITGLVGPNGAGKTTALRLMCALVAPSSGSILTADDPSGAAARMGVLIDSPGLLPSLTARDNLLVLTRLAGWEPAVADQALERVEMTSAGHRSVGTFSLGMKQRIGLAAALLADPDIVILDEPTNGLDPRGKADLRVFLRELSAEGKTVILATHALDEVEELCDHLIAMDRGRVIFQGTPAQMRRMIPETILCRAAGPSERDAAAAAFVDAGYAVALDRDAIRVTADTGHGAVLNRLAQKAGTTLTEITAERPTLEQAFLHLTSTRATSDAHARAGNEEEDLEVPA